MATARCAVCRKPFHGRTEEFADAALLAHYETQHAAGRAERVAAQIKAWRWATYRRLTRALPGWRIFADAQQPLTLETWYAVPAPADTPPEIAVRMPGLLSSNDPDMLLALCRTAQQQRRAA